MLQLYENIKSRRLELGLTQTQLAGLVGYADKSMIARIEAGAVDLPQSKIEVFAKALKTTASELMGWDDKKLSKESVIPTITNIHTPGAYRVPILGDICCGNGIIPEESYKGWFFLDGSIKCDYVLDVKGDSMIDAGIYDGDKVMLLKSDDYIGKICAVLVGDNKEAVLKKVDVDKEVQKYILSSYNKDYPPLLQSEEDILILAECIGVYHAL